MAPDANVVDIENLTVRYGEVTALTDTTLKVGAGRVCALIGMNGSGKSTLFKAIIGLVKPNSGTVELNGRTPREARREGLVGYVPQSEDIDFDFPLSVGDVVLSGCQAKMGFLRHARPQDHEAVDKALDMVGIADLKNRQIGALSGGQKKRTFVARGIAQNAQILLLDEPFAGVDKVSETTIINVIHHLASQGATVLISTHDLAGVETLADEAVLMAGRVLLHDSPSVVTQPDNLAQAFGVGKKAES